MFQTKPNMYLYVCQAKMSHQKRKNKIRSVMTRKLGMGRVEEEAQNRNFQKHHNYPLRASIRTTSCSFSNSLSGGVDTLAHTQASSALSDALGFLAWPSVGKLEEHGSSTGLVSYLPVLHRCLGYPEGISCSPQILPHRQRIAASVSDSAVL